MGRQAACLGLLNPPPALGLRGSQEGVQTLLVRGTEGWKRGVGVAVNSRHAIRERPLVCTISGIRWERGRGGGR